MLSLTQCWFTRTHLPESKKRKEADDSWTSNCRYCGRQIVSWGKGSWSLAGGFNVSRLAETTRTRFLYIVNVSDDFVVARFPVKHLQDEQAIEAYRKQLMVDHKLDEEGSGLELRDSIDDA
jgi:hypothetical protein